MAAPRTEAAIERLRELIRSGELLPGQRLPAEAALSAQLGISRGSLREAVRALATTGVLQVRRGDGTFVTSLSPEQLFTGLSDAVELAQPEALLQLMECRRVVEPQVTALAAERSRPADHALIAGHLARMESASDERELIAADGDFHGAVAAASGNASLAAILRGISSATTRARAWRALTEAGAWERTVTEHRQIHSAVRAGDPALAHAAALVHIASVEAWMRTTVNDLVDDVGGNSRQEV